MVVSTEQKRLYVGDALGRVFAWSLPDADEKHWVKDSTVDTCMACGLRFALVERKVSNILKGKKKKEKRVKIGWDGMGWREGGERREAQLLYGLNGSTIVGRAEASFARIAVD